MSEVNYTENEIDSIIVYAAKLNHEAHKLNHESHSEWLTPMAMVNLTGLDKDSMRDSLSRLSQKKIITRELIKDVPMPVTVLNKDISLSDFTLPQGFTFKDALLNDLLNMEGAVSVTAKSGKASDKSTPYADIYLSMRDSILDIATAKSVTNEYPYLYDQQLRKHTTESFTIDHVNKVLCKISDHGYLQRMNIFGTASELSGDMYQVNKRTSELKALSDEEIISIFNIYEGSEDSAQPEHNFVHSNQSDIKQTNGNHEVSNSNLSSSSIGTTDNGSLDGLMSVLRTIEPKDIEATPKASDAKLLAMYVMYQYLLDSEKSFTGGKLAKAMKNRIDKTAPTVTLYLSNMVSMGLLNSEEVGARTHYSAKPISQISVDERLVEILRDELYKEFSYNPIHAGQHEIPSIDEGEDTIDSIEELREISSIPQVEAIDESNEIIQETTDIKPADTKDKSQSVNLEESFDDSAYTESSNMSLSSNEDLVKITHLLKLMSQSRNLEVMNFSGDIQASFNAFAIRYKEMEDEINMWRSGFNSMLSKVHNHLSDK